MLKSLKSLHGTNVDATDAPVGTVARFLLDADTWTLRYLVVDTGNWWQGHEVLVSPMSIRRGAKDQLTVELSRARIQAGPAYDSLLPVTRKHEESLLGYYGYPMYWQGPYLWGPAGVPIDATTSAGGTRTGAGVRTAVLDPERANEELVDSRILVGLHVHATDGDIGHVDDLLAEDDTWRVRYFVVDTSNWWIGKHVLISPEWFDGFDRTGLKVEVSLTRDAIKAAPEYDKDMVLSRDRESALYRHYDRRPYWDI